jgi:hypothetical protein
MHVRMQVLELHRWLFSALVPKIGGHILLKQMQLVQLPVFSNEVVTAKKILVACISELDN